MSKILASCLLCLILFGLVACGGGGTPTPTPTPTPVATPAAFIVSPSAATVGLGGSQVFSASGTGVTWAVSGPGTIAANGSYLAPASFATTGPATATVTATAGTQKATATVTIIYPNDNAGNQSTPIHLGTSGGNVLDNNTANTKCCIGTLGSLIKRGANTYILSNNHVLARSSQGVAGEAIDQPGQPRCPAGSQGLLVANLSEQAPLKPAGGVTLGPSPSNVDAAIAQIVAGAVVATDGSILDLGAAGANGIASAPPFATPVDAKTALLANEGVAKSGRTTGLTCSTILTVSTDNVQVQYDSSCEGPAAFTAVFNGQVVVNGGSFSAFGDSGSLIVTSDTSAPLALLYAGSPTNTLGNPILDSTDSTGAVAKGVLSAFNNGTAPTIVGSGTPHAVSCAPTTTAQSTQAAATSTAVSAQKQQAALVVRNRHASEMMTVEPAIRSIRVDSSADAIGESALLIELSAIPKNHIPPTIEGVRTKLVYSGVSAPAMSGEEFTRGLSAKDVHRAEYMGPGFQGIGIGRSEDAPGESAIVIFTIKGAQHAQIPAVIDGVRTKVIEGEEFRGTGWNPQLEPKAAACSKASVILEKKPTLK
jgi:hypothetical protein